MALLCRIGALHQMSVMLGTGNTMRTRKLLKKDLFRLIRIGWG